MTLLHVVLLAAAAGGLDPPGTERTHTPAPLANQVAQPDELTFIRRQLQNEIYREQLTQLALERAPNPATRERARREYHAAVDSREQLMRIAQNKHLTFPIEPNDSQHATLERLRRLSGDEFRAAFRAADEDARMELSADAERLLLGGEVDPELRAWISGAQAN